MMVLARIVGRRATRKKIAARPAEEHTNPRAVARASTPEPEDLKASVGKATTAKVKEELERRAVGSW